MNKYGYTYEKIFKHVYRICDNISMNNYLIIGSKKALLVDTGCAVGNLKKLVEELCEVPYYIVNTHGHCDHVAANYQFDEIYISNEDKQMMLDLFNKKEEKIAFYQMMKDYHVAFSSDIYKKQFEQSSPNLKFKPYSMVKYLIWEVFI